MGIFFTNLLTMEQCAEKRNDGYFVKEDEQLAGLIYVEGPFGSRVLKWRGGEGREYFKNFVFGSIFRRGQNLS
ncbi:hypothetical protein MTR_4g131770 [Medicago truncatula]|uniref:Uncharacterized protein n=1 Tax=Medicago truncatula TaxID=3880 RepID=G7JI06_MEDTR|nr:hypothetical protein MTR_4g131770 [Medicago truncatula]